MKHSKEPACSCNLSLSPFRPVSFKQKTCPNGQVSHWLVANRRPCPAVSHHLARLRDTRLVRTRREGNQVFYSIDSSHVAALIREALFLRESEVPRSLTGSAGMCLFQDRIYDERYRRIRKRGHAADIDFAKHIAVFPAFCLWTEQEIGIPEHW